MTNYTTILLPAGLKDDIDWKEAKSLANRQPHSLKIMWKLDLGLFKDLIYPFSHQSQFLSLRLSIDHFKEDIWSVYKTASLGLLLYEGSADYVEHFPWDEIQKNNLIGWMQQAFTTLEHMKKAISLTFSTWEDITPEALYTTDMGAKLLSLFCRDACVDYLNLLAANIPDEIPVYVSLKDTSVTDPALQALLKHTDKYERLLTSLPCEKTKKASTAICLPTDEGSAAAFADELNYVIKQLTKVNHAYRFIPEANLITEWDELDNIIIYAPALDAQGKRKLLGFCAAGGLVITIGKLLNLPNEVAFSDWL